MLYLYGIRVVGTAEDKKAIESVLEKNGVGGEFSELGIVLVDFVDEDIDIVDIDSFKDFVKEMVLVAPKATIDIRGTLADIEYENQSMSFEVAFKDGSLTIKYTDWISCDEGDTEELTEEELNELFKEDENVTPLTEEQKQLMWFSNENKDREWDYEETIEL